MQLCMKSGLYIKFELIYNCVLGIGDTNHSNIVDEESWNSLSMLQQVKI